MEIHWKKKIKLVRRLSWTGCNFVSTLEIAWNPASRESCHRKVDCISSLSRADVDRHSWCGSAATYNLQKLNKRSAATYNYKNWTKDSCAVPWASLLTTLEFKNRGPEQEILAVTCVRLIPQKHRYWREISCATLLILENEIKIDASLISCRSGVFRKRELWRINNN
jgi:hypothetical protein